MFQKILVLVSLSTAVFAGEKHDIYAMAMKVLDEKLSPGNYNPQVRPLGVNGTDAGVIVTVNIFVRAIEKIDDVNMEYSLQLTFRKEWKDERLAYNDAEGKVSYLILNEVSRIWTPELFFTNEKMSHFHNMTTPNVYIKIWPDGSVVYSTRISLRLSCPMDLKRFPMDKQVCTMRMANYGWTTDDLIFLWREPYAVQIGKGLYLPTFDFQGVRYDYCSSKSIGAEYSCLKVEFLLKRDLTPYLLQMYIPCCILVLVSWLPFWLDREAVMARVFVGASTLFFMMILVYKIYGTIAKVSYIRTIDVWTHGCITFTFASLITIVLTSQTFGKSDNDEEKARNRSFNNADNVHLIDTGTNALGESLTGVADADGKPNSRIQKRFARFRQLLFRDANCSARIIFPAAFMLFVICCGTPFWRPSEL